MDLYVDGVRVAEVSREALERALAALRAGQCGEIELCGDEESLILSRDEGAFHCSLVDDEGLSQNMIRVRWSRLAVAAREFFACEDSVPGGLLSELRSPMELDDDCPVCRWIARHSS